MTERKLFFLDKVEGINVFSWCPTPTPIVPPTQVHVHIEVGDDMAFVLRFKGPATLDAIIAALQKHREDVWPSTKM